ncbi:MAG: hypothetical protein M3O34_07415 [Chloroflexota bacterium]|nr:hypothetical protein [Chloroflexota bacterium]
MVAPRLGRPYRAAAVARPGRSRLLWLLVLLAFAILAIALLPLAGRPAAAAQAERPVTLEQITADPAAFHGSQVAVAGEVDMVLSQRAFTIEDDDVLFDDEILVIARDPLSPVAGRWGDAALLEDDIVLVLGTVRPLDLASIEQEIGADLDDDLFAYWTGRSAIVADAVVVNPRRPGPVDASVEDIAEDPVQFYDWSVAVRGEVEEVLGERAFILEQDDAELLVVAARPLGALLPGLAATPLAEDDLLGVRGPVRPFDVARFERDVGVDLDEEALASWEGRPALVARSLQLLD